MAVSETRSTEVLITAVKGLTVAALGVTKRFFFSFVLRGKKIQFPLHSQKYNR